ncbi:hypothetical protein [Calothrix sp. PCC 7507]|uniref:hypothetical protein n=1 Tax=Calothrix sp. PCC 7507 TaxID=99598 RepID=UPI00029ED968|nr:hypothetical protein [Calothrix sp. PCC 7507]AFY34833.1 hypothetical protein Cal7507_4463 [Calothrix sp. PCC 7507]
MNIQLTQPIKWWCFYMAILLLPIAFGVAAIMNLAQSPETADCVSESLSNQAAASVFYCANMLASEPDVNNLYQAIKLVETIPKDNPLYSAKLIDKWSMEILRLSENAVQSGELGKAVDMANMIPVDIPAHQIALKKIQQWKSIWSQAEVIDKAARETIDKDKKNNWYLALVKAKELRKLDNNYWTTDKYQELVHYIQDVREKDENITQMEKEMEEDIAKSTTIKETDLINQLEVTQEAEDIAKLKKARTLASSGKIEDMRSAVDEANLIISDNRYEEAQKFITSIKHKIERVEDSSYLQEAKKLAAKNDEISLQLAISKASLINNESYLYAAASKSIKQWEDKISQLTSQANKPKQEIISNDANTNLNHWENLQIEATPQDLILEKATDTFNSQN